MASWSNADWSTTYSLAEGRTQGRTRQIDIGQLENGCLDVTLIQGCRLAEIFCSKPILKVSLVVVAAGCPRDIFII